MTTQDFILLALQIMVLLACALVFGQLFRRFGQPAVLGELVGGILIGPTVLGALLPTVYAGLFIASPLTASAREAFIKLGMLFFLFIAGLEVNLTDLRRVGRPALTIGLVGTFISLLVGIGVALALPAAFWGNQSGRQPLVFALFLGMCLANSANPVIARILHDLGLLKSDLGAITMTATVVDDLVNWTLLAVVLSQLAPSGSLSVSLPVQLGLLVLFFVLVLGVGHLAAPKILAWTRTRLAWPTGFIMMTTLVILAAGAASEWLGLHAFLGAFLAGVALGSEDPCDQEAHELIANFALSFFAPLYFVSIGLQTNYLNNFAFLQVLVVLAAAFASKFGGVLLAARMAGMRIDRPVWAIAFGLNARGATGIILAGIGLEHGLIDQTMFVTLVIMALATSLVAGPAIKWLTARKSPAVGFQ